MYTIVYIANFHSLHFIACFAYSPTNYIEHHKELGGGGGDFKRSKQIKINMEMWQKLVLN